MAMSGTYSKSRLHTACFALSVYVVGSALFGMLAKYFLIYGELAAEFARCAAYALSYVLPLLILRYGPRASFAKTKPVYWAVSGGLYFCARGAATLIRLLLNIFGVTATAPPTYAAFSDAWILYALQKIMFVPLFEEYMFRGKIMSSLYFDGEGYAIAFSSVFFALAHTDASNLLGSLIMGVALALIYIKTNSLTICMVFHALGNAITLLSLTFRAQDFPVFQIIVDSIFALLCLTAVLLCMFFFIRYHRNISYEKPNFSYMRRFVCLSFALYLAICVYFMVARIQTL